MSIPEELERREARLAAIAEAKTKIEGRAQERLQRDPPMCDGGAALAVARHALKFMIYQHYFSQAIESTDVELCDTVLMRRPAPPNLMFRAGLPLVPN
jgi:hypothetical protein